MFKEVKIHKIGDREILEIIDDVDGETYFCEIVTSFNPCDYRVDEFYRKAIGILMELGAKVNGINDRDDLDEIDDVQLLWEMYVEAETALCDSYLIESEDPNYWAVYRILDEMLDD